MNVSETIEAVIPCTPTQDERREADIEHPKDVRAALNHPGPALVDLVTDPNALSLPPHITGT
jgi:hypothetical protein